MKKVGLTLGKFAPLHRGHQHVIETALLEMEHVIVVIYDAKEVTPVPLSVRAAWIRKLYPRVEVIEGKDGPTAVGYTEQIKRMHEQYIHELLKSRRITHFYSSELYGVHMSQALQAVNRVVDIERRKFPLSGTAIPRYARIRQNTTHSFIHLSGTLVPRVKAVEDELRMLNRFSCTGNGDPTRPT